MRIGVTVDPLSPTLTGIGRYTWQLCQGLVEHPEIENVSYFRNDRWIRDPRDLLAGRELRRSRWPRPVRQWRARSGFRHRLIHGTNYFLPAEAEAGVITVHDMSIFLFPETHPAERLRHFERQFTDSISRAAHIITDSEASRRDFLAHFSFPEDRVTTVHLGVSDDFCAQDEVTSRERLHALFGRDPSDYILAVATFEPRKRIEAAISAHALFCERTGSKVPLVLVGAKGWSNESLHALILDEQQKGRLIVLGFVPEADLPSLYAGARLFVYPSTYEGFGLPPIEAMACGTPTIVSDRSCLPEVTCGAAMMVDPDDIDGFSAAIEQALHDDSWRDSAICAGLAVGAHYSWKRCIDATVEVYRVAGYGTD